LRFIFPSIAVLAVLLSVFLARANFQYAGKLAAARALVQLHVDVSKSVDAASARAQIIAAAETQRADSAESVAKTAAARARALQAQLKAIQTSTPADTAALVAKVLDERDVAVQAGEAWMEAFEQEAVAAASLRIAVDTLSSALVNERAASANLRQSADKLVLATKPGFWGRFVPKVALNATVGIDPTQPEQGVKKVVGLGLSWPL
jgi:crotonobetainyl-CoA:carnitine CoA-transferase CaiB-like acyl-CoA transferase